MVLIPQREDPTLLAIDRILEDQTNNQAKRTYIGASSIGDECSRKLWIRYHTDAKETFSADTIRLFNDGHRTEDVMADHLRMVPGIQLWTHKEELDAQGKKQQYGFVDGAMAGHYDGVILGLLQAPSTPHIWEHKATNEKSFEEFKALSIADEKTALQEWNPVYYAQAIVNMHKEGLDRHYITVSTPGLRKYWSARTEANPVFAAALLEKGKRIARMQIPPERIGNADYYKCKWCAFYGICHGNETYNVVKVNEVA